MLMRQRSSKSKATDITTQPNDLFPRRLKNREQAGARNECAAGASRLREEYHLLSNTQHNHKGEEDKQEQTSLDPGPRHSATYLVMNDNSKNQPLSAHSSLNLTKYFQSL